MELKKYEILVLGLIVTTISLVTLWSGKIEGQERRYPNKPIEVIIPFPPGGTNDVATRIMANELTKELGVPISIQYKPGAGGVIGASYVTTAKPDGYTLLSVASSTLTIAPFIEKEAPFDSLKDFTPIAYYGVSPNVLASHSSSNLTSFDAVVKFAKEKPGTLNCTTVGVGTVGHFLIEVMRIHGVEITHVPAKGGAPAVTNLLGKHVDLISTMYALVRPHVKSGELRILATTNKIVQEPGVLVLKEKGFPETEALSAWQGIFAPPNLPKPICDQLANSFQKVIQMPSVVTALENLGFTVEYRGPDETKKKIAEDYSVMERIAKITGFRK